MCMLFHVLMQCLHVCSETVIHTACDSALQHVNVLLGMVRCCVGRWSLRRDESLQSVFIFFEPRLSAICPPVVPLHCSLLLTPTTLVPKHVSQNNGWILFECVTRACKRQPRPWLPKLCISLYQNRSAGVVGPKPLGFCDFQVWSGGLGTNPESELQNHVFINKLSCFWVGSPGTDFFGCPGRLRA